MWLDCLRVELQRANKLQIRLDSSSDIILSEFQKINFRAEKRILKLFTAAVVYLKDLVPHFHRDFLDYLLNTNGQRESNSLSYSRWISSNAEMWECKSLSFAIEYEIKVYDRIFAEHCVHSWF